MPKTITVAQLIDSLGKIQEPERAVCEVYATNYQGLFPVRSVIIDYKHREIYLDIQQGEPNGTAAKAS